MPSGGSGSEGGESVALCLAGGGYPGAYFEFGAVAALEAGVTGWKAVNSRVIIGTSCGAVVGAVLSLGMTSAEVRAALAPEGSLSLAVRRRDFSRIPWQRHARGWAGILANFPRLLKDHTEHGRLRWGSLVEEARGYLPAGMFSNQGLEDLLRRVSDRNHRGNRFEDLDARLLITATVLDSGERAVFGRGEDESAPVSLAVRASSAIPGFFEPVTIASREFIDGQIYDPIHLDLADRDGVRMVFAVSPLNPFVGSDGSKSRVSRLGTTGVLEQSARISASIKRRSTETAFRNRRPEVVLVSIEPGVEEVYRLMRIGFGKESLLEAWRIGFRSAARVLRAGDGDLNASLESLGMGLDLESLARMQREWDADPAVSPR